MSHDVMISFSSKNLPTVGKILQRLEDAIFDVAVTESFDEVEDLLEWQENNDQFSSGIIFGWVVPRTDDTEDLDFTSGNHSGCECVVGFDGEGFEENSDT